MEKREASFIIDLQKVKIEKQQQTEKALNELLESFFRYLDKEVNIREKVRAREIFFYKTSLSKESIDDPTIAMHFKFWFGFDYVTVIGSRLFDIFIREKKKALSKPMLDISGFLMLMYLQPVTIIDSDSISLRFKSLLSAEDVTTEGCWFLGEKKDFD
ncbi:MAG: hypothetical protein LRY73_09075 [Bacillus sp. (in: Bacteria)]|nr:hypothetical protein [Bacillus sp. (in: firmicutes)]